MYFASCEVRELRPILHGSELAVASEITIPYTQAASKRWTSSGWKAAAHEADLTEK
jgi:hypothetical protein